MRIDQRPTEMLERQLSALRSAARQPRSPKFPARHFVHNPLYRASVVRDVLAMRAELRRRK